MSGEICKSGRRVPALVAGGGGGGENPTRLRYGGGGGGGADSCRGSKVKVTAGRRRQLSQTAEMPSRILHSGDKRGLGFVMRLHGQQTN